MNQDSAHERERLHERVVELETLFTHLQRTFGELDQVVLAQQKQIESLQRTIDALRGEFTSLSGAPQDVPKPEDEKPPHY